MSTPLGAGPVTSAQEREVPAYVSGLVGLRLDDIPLMPGISMVDGFAGLHRWVMIEAKGWTPYPLAGAIRIRGVWLTDPDGIPGEGRPARIVAAHGAERAVIETGTQKQEQAA